MVILLVLLSLLTLPACVPVVTHGPWVAPGKTVGAVVARSTLPVLQREIHTGHSSVTPVYPPFGVFARQGWTPEDHGVRVPVSAGIFLPVALPFSLEHPEGDLFVQLASADDPEAASGVGVLVSPSYAVPYVQAGRPLSRGVRLYTTQSLALFRGGERAPEAQIWMPAVTVEIPGVHLFVQGGLGRERLAPDSVRPVRYLMAGLALTPIAPELRLRAPRR